MTIMLSTGSLGSSMTGVSLYLSAFKILPFWTNCQLSHISINRLAEVSFLNVIMANLLGI